MLAMLQPHGLTYTEGLHVNLVSGLGNVPPCKADVKGPGGVANCQTCLQGGNHYGRFQRKMAVNKQWNKQKPDDWHGSTHHKHREVLYDLLKLDENIEKMVAGHFEPDPEPQDKKMESPMMNPQTGIAVATQDRIIFVAKGIFSKARMRSFIAT